MTVTISRAALAAALASFVAWGSGHAVAQTIDAEDKADEAVIEAAAAPIADAPEADARPKNRLMDEIVVTAQKREEDVQDVPISVSVFSADAMDVKGITEPLDLAQHTPGMYYGQLVNFSVIFIRGIGSDAFLPDSDPSIATYIDGIYYPFANGQSQAFGAVERVEVLKGPQGTLFGRNSTGGAINVVTKAPNTEELELSLQSSYSWRFSDSKNRLYVNVPITDWLAVAASGIYQRADNYYHGHVDKGRQELPKEVSKGLRAKVRIRPIDTVTIDLSYINFKKDGLGSTAMPLREPSLLMQTLGAQVYEDEYRVENDVPAYFAMDNEVFYGQIEWQPRWFDLKVLASKQEVLTDNNYDFDGTSTPFVTFDARGQFGDIKTAEFQILSNGEWGPEWMEWIFGGYYLESSSGFPRNRFGVVSLDLSDGALSLPNPLGNPITVPVPQGLVDILGQIPGFPDGGSLVLHSIQDVETYAFFTQETFHFWDRLHLTVGGRYQWERRTVVESSSHIGSLDQSDPLLLEFNPAPRESSKFTPKVSVAYDVLEDAMVYASWTKGIKSGTFNTTNIYDEAEYVDPEEVTTYELGFKSRFFDGALQVNGAVFRNEIENLQVLFISLLAGGAAQLENAAEAQIDGAELDFVVNPFPQWNPGLVFFGAGAYLDGEYVSYPNGSGFDETTGLYNNGGDDYTGNRVTRTPKFSGSVGFSQLFDLGPGDLEFGGSLYYNSGFFYQASNTDVSRQESYKIVDAQISYLHRDWGARLSLYGRNLTDERYTYAQFHTDAGRQDYLAPPRTFGVRLNVDY